MHKQENYKNNFLACAVKIVISIITIHVLLNSWETPPAPEFLTIQYICKCIHTPCGISTHVAVQTVEAISGAVSHMHPDMQVVLLTFSHRIGIFK